MTVLGVGTKN